MLLKNSVMGLLFATGLMIGNAAIAQDTELCDPNNLVKAGTFDAHLTTVGFMASIRWGQGVLKLSNGETHKFRVIGGKVLETGFGETHLEGDVFNLEKAEDFEGIYYGSSSSSALVKGPEGGVMAKNSSNCVYVHGRSAVAGVRLSPPAPGGVEVKLID